MANFLAFFHARSFELTLFFDRSFPLRPYHTMRLVVHNSFQTPFNSESPHLILLFFNSPKILLLSSMSMFTHIRNLK